MPDTTEEKIQKLEQQAAFVKGALIVAGVAILAFLGITGFVEIPRQVRNEVAARIDTEVTGRVADLKKQFDGLTGSKDAAIKILGTQFETYLPVGTIFTLHTPKDSKPSIPANWLLCDGRTVKDAQSPFNGESVPNLNGEQRFLRGGTESGVLQDELWRTLIIRFESLHESQQSPTDTIKVPTTGESPMRVHTGHATGPQIRFPRFSYATDDETRPKNMSVIYIIKVK